METPSWQEWSCAARWNLWRPDVHHTYVAVSQRSVLNRDNLNDSNGSSVADTGHEGTLSSGIKHQWSGPKHQWIEVAWSHVIPICPQWHGLQYQWPTVIGSQGSMAHNDLTQNNNGSSGLVQTPIVYWAQIPTATVPSNTNVHCIWPQTTMTHDHGPRRPRTFTANTVAHSNTIITPNTNHGPSWSSPKTAIGHGNLTLNTFAHSDLEGQKHIKMYRLFLADLIQTTNIRIIGLRLSSRRY